MHPFPRALADPAFLILAMWALAEVRRGAALWIVPLYGLVGAFLHLAFLLRIDAPVPAVGAAVFAAAMLLELPIAWLAKDPQST